MAKVSEGEQVLGVPAGVRVAVLMLVMVAAGFAAVLSAPDDGHVIGIWPVGVATAALLASGGRRVPLLLGVVAASAIVSIDLAGRPTAVAVGYGLGTAVEVWVVWRMLGGAAATLPRLRTDGDLARYLGACLAGGATMALAGALTSAVTGFGSPWFVALALGTAHLASQLAIVPFFCRLPDHGAVASTRERILQWLTILVVTPLIFTPVHFPTLTFLIIPVLVWSALRIRPFEALVQVCAVMFFAITMTTFQRGPFAAAPDAFELPRDARGVLLAAFAITCVLVVVPLLLRVGQQVVTAREAAAERDRLENIVRGTPGVAIIGTDETGRITLFNPGAERLLSYRASDVLGHDSQLLHTAGAISEKATELGVTDRFADVLSALVGPEVGASELRLRRGDGEERSHLMTISRITDEVDRVVGYVSTSEDVTERLLAESALKEAVDRLQEVDAVKDAFVSTVSHELRTPITSIRGYLEMLEDGDFGELSGPQADAVRRIDANSRRLLGLIDDLLSLSRMQDGAVLEAERAFDLRDVVAAGYDVAVPAVRGRDLELDLTLPPDPVPFLGDPELLERVVVNLVGNAVKFTPPGGRVRVALVFSGDAVELSVADTGIGIPVSEQHLLFQRFFRSELARRNAIQGSGLGLSIARAIVERHGGTIAVESAAGEGTTFRVRLPIVG